MVKEPGDVGHGLTLHRRMSHHHKKTETGIQARALPAARGGRGPESSVLPKPPRNTRLKKRLCESYYCIGALRLESGDRDGAAQCFEKSVATQTRRYFENDFARTSLLR